MATNETAVVESLSQFPPSPPSAPRLGPLPYAVFGTFVGCIAAGVFIGEILGILVLDDDEEEAFRLFIGAVMGGILGPMIVAPALALVMAIATRLVSAKKCPPILAELLGGWTGAIVVWCGLQASRSPVSHADVVATVLAAGLGQAGASLAVLTWRRDCGERPVLNAFALRFGVRHMLIASATIAIASAGVAASRSSSRTWTVVAICVSMQLAVPIMVSAFRGQHERRLGRHRAKGRHDDERQ